MPAWTPEDVRRVVERAVDKVLTGTADTIVGPSAAGCGCATPAACTCPPSACACGGGHDAQGGHAAHGGGHAAHGALAASGADPVVMRAQPGASAAAAAAAAAASARPARVLDWTTAKPGDTRPMPERVPAAPGRASRAPEPADPKRTVAVGGDHGGFALKESIKRFLKDELRYAVIDCGTHSTEAVDYPDVAREVASAVAEGRAFRGVIVDAAGIGSTMAANRVPGARCALCHDMKTAVNSRAHNDANVLALGSTIVHVGLARQIITTWLKTPFEGGRHARRVAKIMELERLRPPAERTS